MVILVTGLPLQLRGGLAKFHGIKATVKLVTTNICVYSMYYACPKRLRWQDAKLIFMYLLP